MKSVKTRLKSSVVTGHVCDNVPLDWTIKSKIIIISESCFEWLKAAKRDTKTISEYASGSTIEDNQGTKFQKLLFSWVSEIKFPPLHSAMIANVLDKQSKKEKLSDNERTELDFFKEKQKEW